MREPLNNYIESKLQWIKILSRIYLVLSFITLILLVIYRRIAYIGYLILLIGAIMLIAMALNTFIGIKHEIFVIFNWEPISFLKGKWFVVFQDPRAKEMAKMNLLSLLLLISLILLTIVSSLTGINTLNPVVLIVFVGAGIYIFKKRYKAFNNTDEENINKRHENEFTE